MLATKGSEMVKRVPLVLSIVGKSDSGKTTLILKLLPELKKRGKKVAVAKHCPCGFDLDLEGKDSWRFTQAGARGSFLSSKDKLALIQPKPKDFNLKKKLQEYFLGFDIVLMEGYNYEPSIKKILIIRRGIGSLNLPLKETVAYVSDIKLSTKKPTFKPNDTRGITSFINKLGEKK